MSNSFDLSQIVPAHPDLRLVYVGTTPENPLILTPVCGMAMVTDHADGGMVVPVGLSPVDPGQDFTFPTSEERYLGIVWKDDVEGLEALKVRALEIIDSGELGTISDGIVQ